MAVIALNKFRTLRVGITTNMVGIYTCPIGVASIVILSQVTNTSTTGVTSVTAVHSRGSESPSDYKFASNLAIPPNDSANLIPDGRLSLETNDVIRIQATANNRLDLILSVLETAKQ
jgi:hypothetical protein